MDNTFPDEESLYRAVYPPEINSMFWKNENTVSSAVFLILSPAQRRYLAANCKLLDS